MTTNGTTLSDPPRTIEGAVVRFCGDSGDGMQLAGGQFSATSAVFGNDIATFPDFPAEIRAPRGTTYGVSGFQLHFSSNEIHTPGDAVHALIAMNPAGFKVNINEVQPAGIVIVNDDEFDTTNLKKCGYPDRYNPLDDNDIVGSFQLFRVPISRLTRESLAESGMGAKDIDRCRNMFALGVTYWLYRRPLELTIEYLTEYLGKEKKRDDLANANINALKAGYYFGETAEIFPERFTVAPAKLPPGTYRRISGNEATILGLAAVASKSGKQILYASYPITPASEILHGMARLKHLGVKTFQAEDEIAAVCAAIGASYAGDIAVTGTSGPGLALKSEAIGLAVMLELPLVVVNVQRAGPATGMPTKTEQADLLQAMFGRSGECPCIILAPSSPSECFDIAIEAVRLSVRHMCPVIILSEGSIANGAEPWRIPDAETIAPIEIVHPAKAFDPIRGFMPYIRDPHTLARSWALPGTPGLEHRVGSLEKEERTGNVSYDAENHHRMVKARQEKVERAAQVINPIRVEGPERGDVLLMTWGGSSGAVRTAGHRLRESGLSVSTAVIRHLNPFPPNLKNVLESFDRVIVPEVNMGQLRMLLRSRFLIDVHGINLVRGRSFRVNELIERVQSIMEKK